MKRRDFTLGASLVAANAVLPSSAKATPTTRQELVSNVSYHVPGDFSNPQTAVNWIRDNLDLKGFAVTLNIAPGVYGPLVISGPFTGQAKQSDVMIIGTQANPFLTTFSSSGTANAFTVKDGAQLIVQGFSTTATGTGTAGRGISVYGDARISIGWWGYGPCGEAHMHAANAEINCFGTHQIAMSAPIFALAEDHGRIYVGTDLWVLNNIHFSTACAVADRFGLVDFQVTAVSSINGAMATGVKYNANQLGIVIGSGAFGLGVLGNYPGVTATGGVYS